MTAAHVAVVIRLASPRLTCLAARRSRVDAEVESSHQMQKCLFLRFSGRFEVGNLGNAVVSLVRYSNKLERCEIAE